MWTGAEEGCAVEDSGKRVKKGFRFYLQLAVGMFSFFLLIFLFVSFSSESFILRLMMHWDGVFL